MIGWLLWVKSLRSRHPPVHPAENNHKEENYVVSFEGEIMVQAESKEKAENQAYDRLASLGQVAVMAFMK